MSREKFRDYPGKPGRPEAPRKCPWCSTEFKRLDQINSHVNKCMKRRAPVASPDAEEWLKS